MTLSDVVAVVALTFLWVNMGTYILSIGKPRGPLTPAWAVYSLVVVIIWSGVVAYLAGWL